MKKSKPVPNPLCSKSGNECSPPEEGMYIHPSCHMDSPTWIRYFPTNDYPSEWIHELICAKCEKVLAQFRMIPIKK